MQIMSNIIGSRGVVCQILICAYSNRINKIRELVEGKNINE